MSNGHGRQRILLRRRACVPRLPQPDGSGALSAAAGQLDHRHRRHRAIDQGHRREALQGRQHGRRRCHRVGDQHARRAGISVRVRRRRRELRRCAARSRRRARCARRHRRLGERRAWPHHARRAHPGRGHPRARARRARGAFRAVAERLLRHVLRRRARMGRRCDETRRIRRHAGAARHLARSHRAVVPVRGNPDRTRAHPFGADRAEARRRPGRLPRADRGHRHARRSKRGGRRPGAGGRHRNSAGRRRASNSKSAHRPATSACGASPCWRRHFSIF